MDKYRERKLAQLVTVQRVENGELHILKKQFNKDTGKETSPVKDTYLQTSLQRRKVELTAELAEVNAMLGEFSA